MLNTACNVLVEPSFTQPLWPHSLTFLLLEFFSENCCFLSISKNKNKLKNKSTQTTYGSACTVTISKWENPDYFLYPDADPDHSENLM